MHRESASADHLVTLPPLIVASRTYCYVALAGGALLAAVGLHDAPLAALGLPALFVAAIGLAGDAAAAEAEIEAGIELEHDVVVAGGHLVVVAVLTTDRSVPRCRLSLVLPERVRPARPPHFLLALEPGTPARVEVDIRFLEAGEASLGPLLLVTSGSAGLVSRRRATGSATVRVRPREEALRRLPRSTRVRVAVGDRLARSRGEGIELAEVRPELPGETATRINWRATARTGVPHVTTRHPEQSTDVVLFVDTFDQRALSRVLEVAAAGTAAYLRRHDRVGLVSFGGVLDWVEAGTSARQLEAIRVRLAATRPFFSYAWKTTERIPTRALPPGALVVAPSALRDERFLLALAEVRARGHDVVVVDVAVPSPPPARGGAPEHEAALLLARLEEEDLRRRLWRLGIAVAPLAQDEPLEAAFSRLAEATRHLRRLR